MFEQIVMQTAEVATTVVPQADPNVLAIGSIMGTAMAIVTAAVGLVKSGKLTEITQALRKDTNVAGQTSVAALQKGTEAKAIALKLAPEDKQELVKAIAAEVKTGMMQVNAVVSDKPQFNPDKLQVPREGFDTKPKVIDKPNTSSEEGVK